MPITRPQLIDEFGTACDLGSAGIFVGAGLSSAAGLPGWAQLLEDPRKAADIPEMGDDLPLLAEYILLHPDYSRTRLEEHILQQTVAEGLQPTESHESIARLGVDQVWTTNYDPLIERADPSALVISNDNDVRLIGSARKTIIKMHGSIANGGSPPGWSDRPIITRSDFETYEDEHRRLWALLRASYLSKTFLFLGFSFADANIDILLRLARRYQMASRDRHIAVMKSPATSDTEGYARHRLKVRDLEESGVRVHEIHAYEDIPVLLTELVRRTRSPRLFVSGSTAGEGYASMCAEVARALVDRTDWKVSSLGGPAGWEVTRELSQIRRVEGTYDPTQLVFYSRHKEGPPPIEMDERVGTFVFTDLEREPLVQDLLDESRAVLVLGGGGRTAEEIKWAVELGVGVVPIGTSGGAAHSYWDRHRADPPLLGGRETDPAAWERLGGSISVAARAAEVLLAQAMYAGDGPA